MTGRRFYHGSRRRFPPGLQLTPQPGGYTHDDEVIGFERLMEARRPGGALSRFQAVFLSGDPALIDSAGGYSDAVYEVEPLSEPQASDLAWYSAAWCEFSSEPCDAAELHRLIDGYWSGAPYPDRANGNIEYRVEAAVVLQMVECNVEPDELEDIDPEPSMPYPYFAHP